MKTSKVIPTITSPWKLIGSIRPYEVDMYQYDNSPDDPRIFLRDEEDETQLHDMAEYGQLQEAGHLGRLTLVSARKRHEIPQVVVTSRDETPNQIKEK